MFGWFRPKTPPAEAPNAEEQQKKLRRVEIVASHLVQEVFAGKYESLFKGQGIEFSDIREYLAGDDVRSIDWNVTARLGKPFVKRNTEERELTLVLMVDNSGSMSFGSKDRTKRDLASQIAAILAFSALQNADKVGLIRFSDEVEHVLPPRKGRKHVMRILGEIMGSKGAGKSNLSAALHALNRIHKRRSLVFLMSDFLSPDFERQLKLSSKRHDLSAFRLFDPLEQELPDVGKVRMRDLETGESLVLDTSGSFGFSFKKKRTEERTALKKLFDSNGVDYAEFSTGDQVVPTLSRFFTAKRDRRRRVRAST